MVRKIKIKNADIYTYGQKIKLFVQDKPNIDQLNIDSLFFLQKNIKLIFDVLEDIESCRMKLGAKYGEYSDTEECYKIFPQNLEIAKQEMENLMNIEQEFTIHIFSFEDLQPAQLTANQIDALIFMINDPDDI